MHVRASLVVMASVVGLLACDTQPVEVPAGEGPSFRGGSPVDIVTGGGQFDVVIAAGTFIGNFGFSAIGRPDGSATGQLEFQLELGGLPIRFHGVVTCVSVDRELNRAWIGGIVTQNDSEHPSYTTERTQPGRDIWFRVLDNGQGEGAEADRTTFVGFEGDRNIITSQEYCDVQPWVEDPPNAATWAVTGNLSIQ